MNDVQRLIERARRLGLDDTSDIGLLERVARGEAAGDEAAIEAISQKVCSYAALLDRLRANPLYGAGSLRRSVEHSELRKREQSPLEGKIVLDEVCKGYLKEKERFKEYIKALRLSELEKGGGGPAARAELERTYIELLPQFERIRSAVLHGWFGFCNGNANFLLEKHYLDRNFFRRERAPRASDRLEVHIQVEQERRKRQKQRAFFAFAVQMKAEFDEFHKRRAKALHKSATDAQAQLDASKKRVEYELTFDERQRRKALQEQNYEEYQKMIETLKNERIIALLADTDAALADVISKMGGGGKAPPAVPPPSGEYDFSRSSLLSKNYEEFYYNLTHRVVVEVAEQPRLLEGGTLKGYQMQGLRWLVSLYANKLNGILADEMGLGKTIQTIALVCYLIESRQNPGPFLVVVPLSTLSNWSSEFEKWAPSVKKVCYKGNPEERRALTAQLRAAAFNVCVTTYEYVLKDKAELSRFHWQYLIVDEGHKMKNPRSKFGHVLGQYYDAQFRLLLTGTPLQNNLTELWALLNFLLPRVFNSCDDFEKWFKAPLRRLGVEKEVELTEEERLLIVRRFHLILRPFLLRRIKREVEAELPQKLEFILKVNLSAWQKVVYNQIFASEDDALRRNVGALNHQRMNNIVMELRKICNHPYLFTNYALEGDELVFSAGKFELLDRIVPKLVRAGHRMLLFTQMTRVIDLLELFMAYRGFRCLRLDGNTKHEERGARMKLFNTANSEYPVFLLSTRAGGLGLNLQTADTVILFDSDWNPQMDLQAQDRAHRIGTRREVRVFRLVSHDTIEERILSKASYKRSLDELVIQAGLYNSKATESERQLHLTEVIKRQTLEKPEGDEVPNDEEINKMLSRDEAEFAQFQEMDRLRYERERLVYPNFDAHANYRLMGLEDLPAWLTDTAELKEEVEAGGRRRRAQLLDLENLRDDNSIDDEYARVERERRRRRREKRSQATKAEADAATKPREEIFFESEEEH